MRRIGHRRGGHSRSPSHSGDEGSMSDVDENIETQEPIGVEEEPALIFNPHVKPEQFRNKSQVILNISVTATPEQLEQGHVSTVWTIPPSELKNLKQNMAKTNRHLATEADLLGDLKKCVPLEFQILRERNSFPYAMGIQATGLLAKSINQDGTFLWRVDPDTQPHMVGISVFEPTSPIDASLYSTARGATLRELDEAIKHHKGTKGKADYATIAVGTLPYEMLCLNLEHGHWREEGLTRKQLQRIFEPERYEQTVQVTPNIAATLKERLTGPLKDIHERCIDMEKFSVNIMRADGNPSFSSPQGLHLALPSGVGSKLDEKDGGNLGQLRLKQTCNFSVAAAMTFILLDE